MLVQLWFTARSQPGRGTEGAATGPDQNTSRGPACPIRTGRATSHIVG